MDTEPKLPTLRELHQRLYRRALESGTVRSERAAAEFGVPLEEVEAAIEDLLTLHLLHQTQLPAFRAHGDGRSTAGDGRSARNANSTYTANSPDVAVAHLNGPVEARIRQLQRQVDQVNNHVMTMRTVFEEAWQSHFQQTTAERLNGLDAIRTVLERLTVSATFEIASAHPSVPAQKVIDEGRSRTVEAAERGIRLRTIYPHSVLSHPYMRQHMSAAADAGVQFRTVAHIPDRVILFDAETAVVTDPDQPDGEGALVVRDPSLARHLYRSWESVWEAARPFTVADTDESAAPKDEMRRAVLQMLDSGMKDEMAARRLSMSTTTYRRHVSELLLELGAQSRFQAGSYARRVGWLEE